MVVRILMASLLALSLAATARGGYTLGPPAGPLTVMPGDAFDLPILISSDANDESRTALFQVVFSKPGLLLTGYEWSAPYLTGGVDDDSTPHIDLLNAEPGAKLVGTTFADASAIDIELTNALDEGKWSENGTLVTLFLKVPDDYVPVPDAIVISVVPDQFLNANVFGLITTQAGPAFTLNIVPEPSVLAICVVGLLAALRRW